MRDILLIDDDPLMHSIVNRCAKDFPNLRVEGSLDGRSIIEFLESYKDHPHLLPDYILLDLNMPDFSGWDFLNKFGELSPLLGKKVHIYVITGIKDPVECLRAWIYPNVEGVFHKPFTSLILQSLAA